MSDIIFDPDLPDPSQHSTELLAKVDQLSKELHSIETVINPEYMPPEPEDKQIKSMSFSFFFTLQ